jgi:diketogulonate reductase-like aldo/keto reductase
MFLVLIVFAIAVDINWTDAAFVVKSPMESPDGEWKAHDSITFHDVWAEMEKIYESGRAKAIGVSNFSIKK